MSRVTLDDQWRVSTAIIQALSTALGTITIDRFATNINRVCEQFNSYFVEEDSAGIDAFAQQDYNSHRNYAFPPVSILGRFLIYILRHWPDCELICVFPLWRAQPWFPLVHELFDTIWYLPDNRLTFEPTRVNTATPLSAVSDIQYMVGSRNIIQQNYLPYFVFLRRV